MLLFYRDEFARVEISARRDEGCRRSDRLFPPELTRVSNKGDETRNTEGEEGCCVRKNKGAMTGEERYQYESAISWSIHSEKQRSHPTKDHRQCYTLMPSAYLQQSQGGWVGYYN